MLSQYGALLAIICNGANSAASSAAPAHVTTACLSFTFRADIMPHRFITAYLIVFVPTPSYAFSPLFCIAFFECA